MIIDTVIRGVSYRDVNRRSDNKPIRIFEILDASDIKWTTNRKDIADEANRRIGQAVQLQGRIEENGIYTNHYLDMVAEAGVLTPGPSDSFPIPGVVASQIDSSLAAAPQAPAAPIQPQAPPQPAPIQPTGWLDDHQWAIMRQTAGKVSASLSDSPAEFWGNLDDLLRYFAYGTKPSFIPSTTPPTLEGGNQFIPEGTPIPEGHSPYDDSDIPFS